MKNPFDYIFAFEEELSRFTGAPYVITTDRCTHAIELCLIYNNIDTKLILPSRTYISIPQTLRKLSIDFSMEDTPWDYEYNITGTNIWDSARRFEKNMYRQGTMQCLSFGRTKPLEIGLGGAILTDNKDAYEWLSMTRSDGRDLRISPWETQKVFPIGFHYYMRPEECKVGIEKLHKDDYHQHSNFSYPDCSQLIIGEENG